MAVNPALTNPLELASPEEPVENLNGQRLNREKNRCA